MKFIDTIENSEIIRKNKNTSYYSEFICLDIETSSILDIENPNDSKCWINSIQLLCGDEYIHLRKPSELINLFKQIAKITSNKVKVVTYVHNLAFDMSYLIQWFTTEFGKPTFQLATAKHKLITIQFKGIEFRCSMRLSGKSLDKWSKDLNTKHRKLVGTYDYSKLIYQDTKLDAKELEYDKLDVVVLRECILKQMQLYNDTIASIPLTSTGYVRRLCRSKYFEKYEENRMLFEKLKLNKTTYEMLNNMKNGGYTHLNNKMRNKTIYGNIEHGDFDSHYPTQQICEELPMGKFTLYSTEKHNITIEDILNDSKHYYVVDIILSNLEIKEGVTLPFLQYCKCAFNKAEVIQDNGRVISIQGGIAMATISSIMLYIINEQYDFDYKIIRSIRSKKGKLPDYIQDTVKEQYKAKTDLKDKCLECEKFGLTSSEYQEAKLNLLKAKGLLNGIFGMTFENPVKDNIIYDAKSNEWVNKGCSIEKSLSDFYKNKNSFLAFQWGCFTPEIAKLELYKFIKLIGYENCIYCDTDSIFYLSNDEIRQNIKEYNQELLNISVQNDYCIITNKGTKKYFNKFDSEPDLKAFRSLHSKCYATITEEGELVSTIAGVCADNKKLGPERVTREDELVNIDNLKPNMRFKECGGTCALYVHQDIRTEIINGHEVELGNGCIIRDVEKTLDFANDNFYVYANIKGFIMSTETF